MIESKWFSVGMIWVPGMIDVSSWLLSQRWWLEGAIQGIWAIVASAVILPLLASSLPTGFHYSMTRMMSRGKLWKDGPGKLLKSRSGRCISCSSHEDSRRSDRTTHPHTSQTTVGVILGALSDASVPQSYFGHFYVVATAWNAILLLGVVKMIMMQLHHNQSPSVAVLLPCVSSTSPSMSATAAPGKRERNGNINNRSEFVSLREEMGTTNLSAREALSSPTTDMSAGVSSELLLLMILVQIHVIRRLYESFFVFKYNRSARMHIAGYITGLCFYVGVPVSVLLHPGPLVATPPNAPSLGTSYFEEEKPRTLPLFSASVNSTVVLSIKKSVPWLTAIECAIVQWKLIQCLGLCIFFWGSLHQWRCHRIMAALRSDQRKTCKSIESKAADGMGVMRILRKDEVISGDRVYGIPRGDWFESVSCAHFLAEIVIYAGLVLASGGKDSTLWLLFTFVVGNLFLAAKPTHKWYHLKFENYPKHRTAIIPFWY